MIFGLFGGAKKRNQQLRDAASEGQVDLVKDLLAKGADPQEQDPESGETALNLASNGGFVGAVAALLLDGAPVDLRSRAGYTPLYIAAAKGDAGMAIVELLLGAGAGLELGPATGNDAGATALYVAASRGALQLSRRLLAAGASPALRVIDGSGLLHAAALGGNAEVVRLAAGLGMAVDAVRKDGLTPLHVAALTGQADAAAALVDLGAALEPVDGQGRTPLIAAALNNRADAVKLLLARGAKPDAVVVTGSTELNALCGAAINGFDEVVKALTDGGALVDAKLRGQPAIIDLAKQAGHENTVAILMAARKRQRAAVAAVKFENNLSAAVLALDGAAIRKFAEAGNFKQVSADLQLMVRSMIGNAEQIRNLIKVGANPNFRLQGWHGKLLERSGLASPAIERLLDGSDPLFAAVSLAKDVSLVEALLDSGASLNATSGGCGVLFLAASNRNTDIAHLLIARGADVNAVKGVPSILIMAAAVGNVKLIDAVLDAGASIDEVDDESGFSAFGCALNRRHLDFAKHLLDRGAAPLFDKEGTLARVVAEHGTMELIHAIELAGGSVVTRETICQVAFAASRNRHADVLEHVLAQSPHLTGGNGLVYPPLILASLANRPALVDIYLNRGDDPSLRDADLETALSLAIEQQHDEVVAVMRRHRSEVRDFPGLDDQQAMFAAASDGALGTILELHDRGVSLNTEDAVGNSPLMLAALAGHIGTVRSLFHLGAGTDHVNHAGLTISQMVHQHGDQAMLETLMEFNAVGAASLFHGIPPGLTGDFHMMVPVRTRSANPFKQRLPYDVVSDEDDEDDEDDEGQSDASAEHESQDGKPFISDEISSTIEQLEDLLQMPHIIAKMSEENREVLTARIENIRTMGESAVPHAWLDELIEVCNVLAQQPESEQNTPPLFEVVTDGRLKALKDLLKSGADINQTLRDGTTLLMVAIQNGHDAIVKELIKAGADVNKRQNESFTALIYAVFLGNETAVRILLANGADVNMGHSLPSSEGSSGGQTALTLASQRKNISMCKLLLSLGANVNVVTESGYSALMWALANAEDGDCARILLAAGADPDPDARPIVSFATLTSPLILAATNGATDIVKELIRRKVRLDKPDGDECTALKRAANSGHVDIVAALVKAGASVDVADHEGWTALMTAAGHGQIKICTTLIKAGADVKVRANSGVTALSQATGARADGRALDALKNLKKLFSQMDAGGEDDDGENETNDVAADSLKLTSLILKQGANPNVERDGTPLLEHAINDGDEDLVKLLKEYGAIAVEQETDLDLDEHNEKDTDGEGPRGEHVWDEQGEALLDAVLDCSVEPIAEILDQGANIDYVNAEGKTALAVAVYGLNEAGMARQMHRNLLEVADYLLRRGAGVNVPGCDPTPLGWAACAGEIYLVNAMLQRGADPDTRLSGRTTALLTALAEKREICALALIAAGANMKARSSSSQTALHIASEMGLARVVDACLARSPDLVNTVDDNASTSLMLAAIGGHNLIIQSLLQFGADRTLKDIKGQTAKDVAIKNGNVDLVPLLN